MESSPASGRPLTTPAIAARMARQARRDTAPELALRRELHRRGLRFRVEFPLPSMPRRRADIAFTRQRIAVFVDGCFWHSCPEHRTAPASNGPWWAAKLARNVERDRDTDQRLGAAGWTVLRFWEHEDVNAVANSVELSVRVARERADREPAAVAQLERPVRAPTAPTLAREPTDADWLFQPGEDLTT